MAAHGSDVPVLSVVLPAYDAANVLPSQLDALVRQVDAPEHEVLVCENGSSDETRLIAERYAAIHPHVRVVDCSARKGASYARNAGVSDAAAALIAFCDADDVVSPHWVRAMADALASHPLVCGAVEYDKLNPAWLVDVRDRTQVTEPLFMSGGPPWPFGLSANLGVHRTWHERVGGFDESLTCGEDIDYAWRMQRAGASLHFHVDAVLHYRVRADLVATYRQMRAYALANRSLQTRWAAYWPVPVQELTKAEWRRLALRRLWWVRSRTGLGKYVRELGWTAGYVADGSAEPVLLTPLPEHPAADPETVR